MNTETLDATKMIEISQITLSSNPAQNTCGDYNL